MTVFAKSFGPPPPPAGGPMGGPPPAGGGFPPAPQQFPAPTGGFPPPTGGPQAPLPAGNAGRRKKFGAALEGMIQPPARPPQMSQPQPPQQMQQRQMMPPQLPPQMGGNAPSMMPRNQMVAPGTPMMRTPTARPMAMGGEVDIFGYDDGGAVMGTYGWGGGEGTYGVTQARDSSGDIVPGMFVAKYADGSYSAPVTAANIEGLRQGILKGTVTSGDYTADEAANMAGGSTYLKTDNVNVVDEDVSGGFGGALGFSNEMLGNDTVYMSFADGSKLNAQKGMIDAMNEYGLLDNIQSRDDFNQMVQNISAASVRDPESDLGKAHSLFNEKQIAYNEALRSSDPNIQKNIDTFRGYYAPEPAETSTPTPDPASSTVDPYSGSYTPDPVDSSQVGEINYNDFTGDIGATYTGYPETSQTPDNAALFGPNINIPQRVSQYYTDAVTGGLTTTNGPVMTATSPIGAINLPARPVSIDVFDWLRSPTYGSIDPIKGAELEEESLGLGDSILNLQEGGAVNSFDDGTYTIRDLNSGETEKYESGQSYGEEDLPADVAYSKQVQENRAKLGLPANETSAWSMWQQGTHWSQKKPSETPVSFVPDTGAFQSGTSETIISSPVSSSVSASPSESVTQASTVQEPINYDNFTGDIGETYGGYPEGSRTPDTAALFGPNVSIPKYESKYVQDPVTRTITTTAGPTMTAVSPIGAINLPASPIDLDIFDFLRDPVYGSLNPIGLRNGGSVPRSTMIADQPHMLAYINQDEEALLRSFGGSGVSGPGGIPSYPPDSVIDADYSIIRGGGGHPTDDDDKPSKNVTYYEPPGFDFDGDGVSGEGSDVLSNNDSNPFVDLPDFSDDNVVPVSDPSDEDYGSGSSETDFNQPVVVDKTVVKPKPRPTYNDLHGNTFYSQAEADASNRAYSAQAALYGSGKVGFDRFAAQARDSDIFDTSEEANRAAASAYPTFLENYNEGREINIFDPAPFTYTSIGGIGSGPEGGSTGITPAPITSSPKRDYAPIDIKDGIGFEGQPVISLDAPVKDYPSSSEQLEVFIPSTDPDANDPRGNQIVSPTGTGIGLQSDLQRGLGTPSTVQDVAPPEDGYTSLQSLKDRIARAEGTSDKGGYNRLLGNQEGRFGVDLTNMTVQEVLDFQKKRGEGSYAEYSQGVNKQRGAVRDDGTGKISTPAGKYQVVGSTLQSLVDQGIVDPDAKFNEATQERIGTHLIMNDLAGGKGLSDLKSGKMTLEEFEAALGKQFEGIARGLDKGAGSTALTIGAASETAKKVEEDRRDDNVEKIQQQIGDDAEPTGVEAFFYDVISKLGLGLGKGLADDLRGKSREARQSIIDQHVYALQNGATPKTDKDGDYVGFDISTMDIFADKVLGAEDIATFLPGGAEDADGDGVLDSVRFDQVYGAQSTAADALPKYDNFKDYLLGVGAAGSTEQGFITPDGKEFFVDATGKVVEITDDVVPFEVGGGQDVAAALGVTETTTDDDDSGETKNYTVGPDGNIICNDEGYVYSEAAGMCVPVEETDSTPTITPRDATTRSLEDIIGRIATPGPKIAPISANIRPMQGGGMAGLNRAADNFLKALAG